MTKHDRFLKRYPERIARKRRNRTRSVYNRNLNIKQSRPKRLPMPNFSSLVKNLLANKK
jgi:hypothetical protein